MLREFRPPELVGFVGLGQMGVPMATNLARAGFRLAVADSDPRAVERFRALQACEAPATPSELGRACRVVITMLPDGEIVRSVVLGKAGVAAGMQPGSVVIDMSSSSPVGTRRLGDDLARMRIQLVDAPVSGGVPKAKLGTLAIMAGGDTLLIDRCRPMLSAMGSSIFATGPSGSGHAMKALNNYVSAAGLAAAIEAVLAGQRFGLDPAVVVDVLNASTGRNNSTENKLHQFVLSRRFDAGFSLGLMVKDLRTALEVAHATGTPVPLGEACVDAWSKAEALLGKESDHTAVARYWEHLAGVKD
jgi:3-hydroxyisobutyrate dehydrogenase